MQAGQLAAIFKERYHSAPKGEMVTTIHVFGIEFAGALRGHSIKEICALADVPVSYVTEVHKGMRLSQYVSIKP
jgi:hypothetical protein